MNEYMKEWMKWMKESMYDMAWNEMKRNIWNSITLNEICLGEAGRGCMVQECRVTVCVDHHTYLMDERMDEWMNAWNECKINEIPYLYLGKETQDDDIHSNAFDIKEMPFLYQLTDIYLITSKSEGGPKAAIEATASKTMILSTDVGLAPDFIDKNYVFQSELNYATSLNNLVNKYNFIQNHIKDIVTTNYINCKSILKQNSSERRLDELYENIFEK